MANSPVKIKDHRTGIDCTRKELLDEENMKIIGNKGFVFHKYKTEKQRIEEVMKERETIYIKENMLQLALAERKAAMVLRNSQSPSVLGSQSERSNFTNHVQPTTDIIQPTMRFKARTDLERIFDAINRNSFGRADREIIDKQLRTLELNVSKRIVVEDDDLLEEIPDYSSNAVKRRQKQLLLDRKKELHKKMLEEKNSRKKKLRKKVDNTLSRHLMSDLHLKTHFKAATGYTLFKDRTVLDSSFFKSQNSNINSYNQTTRNFKNQNILNKSNHVGVVGISTSASTNNFFQNKTMYNSNSDYFTVPTQHEPLKTERSTKSIKPVKLFDINDSDISREILQSNPLLYKLNENPYRKKYENLNVDDSKLQYLKNLAFANPDDEDGAITLTNQKSAGKLKTGGFFKKLKSRKNLNGLGGLSSCNSLNKSVNNIGKNIPTEEAESNLKNNPLSFFVKLNERVDPKKIEEEKIMIDGELFMRNDIEKITKKVLSGCNYTHTKNKNNSKPHKSGNGKLMFTSGMTLNEFTKKYNLKL